MDLCDNPIKSVFICYFHYILGPKIMYQVPKDYISKETFETLIVYLIPKVQLLRCTITVTTKNTKILGYPIQLCDSKYNRNMFYFNVCFVFDQKSHTLQFEPIVKKLGNFFYNLEIENMYLSKSEQSPETQKHILSMLRTVMNDLNMHKKCIVSARDIMANLCVVKVPRYPPIPSDFDVPIFVYPVDLTEEDWDLITRQIASFINGVNHIAKIAELATVDIEVVSMCVQNLIYYNAVTLVDLFRYSNMYVCTTKIGELARNKSRYKEAIDAISRPSGPKATIKNIFTMFSAMRQGSKFMDICLRLNPVSLNIDERNLVLYGLVNGYIRHLKKYPVVLKKDDVNTTYMGQYYNGLNSLDIVSSHTDVDLHSLDKEIERDLRIVSVWK